VGHKSTHVAGYDLEAGGPIGASAGAFFDAPPGLINDWSLLDVKVALFNTVQRLADREGGGQHVVRAIAGWL
jgi:hypothetical protein